MNRSSAFKVKLTPNLPPQDIRTPEPVDVSNLLTFGFDGGSLRLPFYENWHVVTFDGGPIFLASSFDEATAFVDDSVNPEDPLHSWHQHMTVHHLTPLPSEPAMPTETKPSQPQLDNCKYAVISLVQKLRADQQRFQEDVEKLVAEHGDYVNSVLEAGMPVAIEIDPRSHFSVQEQAENTKEAFELVTDSIENALKLRDLKKEMKETRESETYGRSPMAQILSQIFGNSTNPLFAAMQSEEVQKFVSALRLYKHVQHHIANQEIVAMKLRPNSGGQVVTYFSNPLVPVEMIGGENDGRLVYLSSINQGDRFKRVPSDDVRAASFFGNIPNMLDYESDDIFTVEDIGWCAKDSSAPLVLTQTLYPQDHREMLEQIAETDHEVRELLDSYYATKADEGDEQEMAAAVDFRFDYERIGRVVTDWKMSGVNRKSAFGFVKVQIEDVEEANTYRNVINTVFGHHE